MTPAFLYNRNMELINKKLFLLDMDGTIYLGNDLFDGTKDFLSYVKEAGGRYIFLTNNSSKSKADYVKKLRSLGVETATEDFFTSVDATAAILKKKYESTYRTKKMYVLGTKSLCRQMSEEGFRVTEELTPGIDILLVGYDRELNYGKLEDACFLLKQGVDYFATNPDWVCPTEWGFVPDCGAICQMLEHASKRKPHFIGKPKADIALMALEQAGVSKEETLLVGDRLYTDIACGFNAEIDTCFVLSGEGTLEDMEKSSVKPTYVMKDIKELLRRIKYET